MISRNADAGPLRPVDPAEPAPVCSVRRGDARFAVAAFRADVARSGAARKVEALVDDLCRLSPEFAAMWRDNDVRSTYGEGPKHLRHPRAGRIALEYSAFAVDGRPDLSMVIYNPATSADADKIRSLVRLEAAARARTPNANSGSGKTRGRVRSVAERNQQRGRRG